MTEKSDASPELPMGTRLQREAIIGLHTARAFLPGLLERRFLWILPIILPLVDLTTDWINAGRAFSESKISTASRSIYWAIFINCAIYPMITGLIKNLILFKVPIPILLHNVTTLTKFSEHKHGFNLLQQFFIAMLE